MENNRKGFGSFCLGLVVGLLTALIITSVIFRQNVSLSDDSFVNQRVLEKIENLEQLIHRRFYLSEMTDAELEEGMYRGIMAALNDPYSEYYTEEELVALLDSTEGIYYGIGAYVGLDPVTSLPKISGVIKDTPAQEADLRPDDLIYEVDGKTTYGLSLTEAVSMIKGPEGTKVHLTIVRDGETDYLELDIVRRKVESPTVEFEMLEDGMAYIQILEFDDVTVDQFADALAMAKGSDMGGLILDLRANPGGSLTAVVEIAQMLLPEGLIVYTEDKAGKKAEYYSDGRRELQVPLVVLIDGNSASASEILAGAIQDYELGTLVGTTTFGKGIVQQIIALDDGSAVKLTISSYFTPNGRNIHGTGIEPDVEWEFDGEAYYRTEDPYDNQLEKAKEVLREMM
ncbi:MAG: S41 family peptidase [Clostridium sp.]|nr:S41 family peptidase [Acetatifactor muris]MCM1526768.1 S41 family peptidase [Bacteroides sp.]MCM1562772.1 S41 family peptidase [Clostridium sp.]